MSKRKCRLEPTVSFVAEPRAAINTRKPATARRYAKRSSEESPGAIKVVKVRNSGDYEYKEEYFADGVRPRGIEVFVNIMSKAFAAAQVIDINPKMIAE